MWKRFRQFLTLFLATGREMVVAPSRWSTRRWIAVLAGVAATVAAYGLKWPLWTVVSAPRCRACAIIAQVVDVCGSGFAVLTLLGASYVAGRTSGRSTVSRFAAALAVGGLWCWLLTEAGQWLLAEQRPSEGGAMRFLASSGHGVSGHASAAALLYAPVLEFLAKSGGACRRNTVRCGLWGWAALVGWSRLWLGRHFLWNVLLGFAIGAVTGACGARVVARTPDADLTS